MHNLFLNEWWNFKKKQGKYIYLSLGTNFKGTVVNQITYSVNEVSLKIMTTVVVGPFSTFVIKKKLKTILHASEKGSALSLKSAKYKKLRITNQRFFLVLEHSLIRGFNFIRACDCDFHDWGGWVEKEWSKSE